ncbi:MAG: phosphatase PAP2 family protein [Deltaproteobacteria bacterium]|nr:phosphatase PAP2 family protein [Deltaproteobacteria bacterium]
MLFATPALPLDWEVLDLLNGPGHPALDRLAMALSSTPSLLGMLVLLAAYVAWKSPHGIWGAVVLLATAGVSDFGTSHLVKPIFQRQRPCRERPDLVTAIDGCGPGYAFPSNHATNVAAVAMVAAWTTPGVGPAVTVLALAVGWSRIHLGVHWPTDVLAGFILGLGIGWLMTRLILLRHSIRPAR